MCACRSVSAALLRGDEAVFHRMGHAHADGEADDARRALERMRGAHARFELIGRRRRRARAPAGPRSAPAPAFRPPRGTGRASRTGSRSGRSCEAPLQRVEQRAGRRACRPSARATPAAPSSRSTVALATVVGQRPSTPADGSGECRALHRRDRPRERRRGGAPAGAGSAVPLTLVAGRRTVSAPTDLTERHTDQQFAAYARQAEHDAVRPVRQRMNGQEIRDFDDRRRSAARATPTPTRKMTTDRVSASSAGVGWAK